MLVHQQVLNERSDQLTAEAKSLFVSVCTHPDFQVNDPESFIPWSYRALFLLEGSVTRRVDSTTAMDLVSRAADIAGIKADLTGAMGRRTKFQQNDLPQLKVELKIGACGSDNDGSIDEFLSIVQEDLPKDVKLEDEVRLERVKFADASSSSAPLSLIGQCVVMGKFTVRQRARPKDELTREELQPFLEIIIENRYIIRGGKFAGFPLYSPLGASGLSTYLLHSSSVQCSIGTMCL